MPAFREERVDEITHSRPGLQRVRLANGDAAYAITDLVGELSAGDRVVVNTTAVDLGLGTGGSHVVHVNLDRPAFETNGGGHVMKARYLSEQIDAGSWEEDAPPHDELPDLSDARVALCVLHSHLPAIAAAAVASGSPPPAFVMADHNALPLVLSDVVHELRTKDLLAATVSAGQSFGGDIEAVNVASGVDAALRAGHRSIVVAGGPGHVGTGSALGFSALDLAGHATTLRQLGADVALVVRASSEEARTRHREISHHTVHLLDLVPVALKVPVPVPPDGGPVVDHGWITSRGHEPALAQVADVPAAFERFELDVDTMGRRLGDDRLALAYLGAAASWLSEPPDRLDRLD